MVDLVPYPYSKKNPTYAEIQAYEQMLQNIQHSVAHTKFVSSRQRSEQEAKEALASQYLKFEEYRNAHIEEIAAKAQNVDPAKVHQRLHGIIQEKGLIIDTAADFVGGWGKHTKFLFDAYDCNVVYSDVSNLTQKLPENFNDLQAVKNEDGTILLLEQDDPTHWIYGINALPNEVEKTHSALKGLMQKGLAKSDKVSLFLGNDMVTWVAEPHRAEFGRSVVNMMEPGGIGVLSARTVTKSGHAVKDEKEIIDMLSNCDILWAGKEDALSQKESAQDKKYVRVIFQKLAA